ncbi:MAG: Spy/CpxP family protein refolding chaperone [Acidobacteriota bacterium]
MRKVSSRRNTPAMALFLCAIVALVLLPADSVRAGVREQSAIDDKELGARIRAQMESLLADLRAQLSEVASAVERLKLQAADEERMLQLARSRAGQLVLDRRRMGESLERALSTARRAAQRARREVASGRRDALHLVRGCEEYGEEVLDHAEELELNEEQVGKIRDLQRDHRRASIERRAEIEVAEMDLEGLADDPDADLAAIQAKLEELAGLRVDERMAGLHLKRDVRQVLNQEQLDKLEELHEDHDHLGVAFAFSRIGRLGC